MCAVDFLQFQELQDGLAFLSEIEGFGNFIEVYKLHEDFNCNGETECTIPPRGVPSISGPPVFR